MAYVITQNCCKDASCVPVCPVDCIRPVAAKGGFTDTEMLYIDPEACIDCGACVDECPVDAIHYADDLPESQLRFQDLNADYFKAHPLEPSATDAAKPHAAVDAGALRVAIVGAGPAACYTAAVLLETTGVTVNIFEQLPTPFGLVRAGVAPDHQSTKAVTQLFDHLFSSKRVNCYLNVEVGRELTHSDLLAHHHAVVYAIGAAESRVMGISGEELRGNHTAADFVGWYNGHPHYADRTFELSGPRAVLVGNGNVALDIARVLLLGAEVLTTATDIAGHALEAIGTSGISEVVVLGRRGIRHAAFTVGEFQALGDLPGVDVVIDGDDLSQDIEGDVETQWKIDLAREFAARPTTAVNKRIVFRFHAQPLRLVGDSDLTGIAVSTDDGEEVIDSTLVVQSIGYRGRPIEGLPFDDRNATVPNDSGRVIDGAGDPVAGVYVTGWIKRGPRGVIGTNRSCAEQTVSQLWSDFDADRLGRSVADQAAFEALLTERGIEAVDGNGWRRIDRAERAAGAAAQRPRVKYTSFDELLAAARDSS